MSDEKGKNGNVVEKVFEGSLWYSRFFVILAVVFGLLSSLALFVIASFDVYEVIVAVIDSFITHSHSERLNHQILSTVIGAVDLYLIGVVLLIFSFGIYELFISEVDIAREDKHVNALEIHSLDELKNKITKVIIMVLIVSFFQRVLSMEFKTPLEMLYLALSILALSAGLFFLHKFDNSKKSAH